MKWIWTEYLWRWKQPLHQKSHCPPTIVIDDQLILTTKLPILWLFQIIG